MQQAPISADFTKQMLMRDMSKNRMRKATGAIMAAFRGYTDALVEVHKSRSAKAQAEAQIRLANRKDALDRELEYAKLDSAKEVAQFEADAEVAASEKRGADAARAKAAADENIAGIRAASEEKQALMEQEWRTYGFDKELEGIRVDTDGEKFAAELEKDWQQYIADQEREADIYISDKSYAGKVAELNTEEFKSRLNAKTAQKLQEIKQKIEEYKADKGLAGTTVTAEATKSVAEIEGKTEIKTTEMEQKAETDRMQMGERGKTDRVKAKILANQELQANEISFLREKLKANQDALFQGFAQEKLLKEMDLASELEITDMELKAELEQLQAQGDIKQLVQKIRQAGLNDRLADQLLADKSLLDMALDFDMKSLLETQGFKLDRDTLNHIQTLQQMYLDAMLDEESYSGGDTSNLPTDFSGNLSPEERVERLDVGIDYALDNIVLQLKQAGVRLVEGFDAWRGELEAGVNERLTNPAVTDADEKRRDVINYLTNALNSRVPELRDQYQFRAVLANNVARLDEALGPDGELDTGWWERNRDTMFRWFGKEASEDYTKARSLMRTMTLDEIVRRSGHQVTNQERAYISSIFPKGQYDNSLNRSLIEELTNLLNNEHRTYFATYMGERMADYAGPLIKFAEPALDALRLSMSSVLGEERLATIEQRWENGITGGRTYEDQMKGFEGWLNTWDGDKTDKAELKSYIERKYRKRYEQGAATGIEGSPESEMETVEEGEPDPAELHQMLQTIPGLQFDEEQIAKIEEHRSVLEGFNKTVLGGDDPSMSKFRNLLGRDGFSRKEVDAIADVVAKWLGREDASYSGFEQKETTSEESAEGGEALSEKGGEETGEAEGEMQGPPVPEEEDVRREPLGLREVFETIDNVDFEDVNEHIGVLFSGEPGGVTAFRVRLAEAGYDQDTIDAIVHGVIGWMRAMGQEE